MRPFIAAVTVLATFTLALVASGASAIWSPVFAATATGATSIGTPIAGTSVAVDVSIVSETPVVAYEYALVNECYLSGKPSGRADTYQRDDIVSWNFSAGDVPHATMLIGLESIPVDAVCKVYIVRGNALVKDSLTQYTVVAYAP
jgi:hypothetical protein